MTRKTKTLKSEKYPFLPVVLNIIIPGVGSMIVKKYTRGIIQLLMFLIAFFVPLPWMLGLIIWFIAVIWGVTSVIKIIEEDELVK
jgi:TM2 domain-containing membrane protein YozV